MGRKRTGARKHLYFCIANLIFLTSLGCATSEKTIERIEVEVATLKPSEEGVQAKPVASERPKLMEPTPTELIPVGAHVPVLRAKKLFSQGDYEGSLKENEKALSLSNGKPPADEALFNMGLIYVHFANPRKDYGKALGFLKRLMKEYPQSPWTEEAKVWVAVLQENEKLSEMIEKSKQVDIEIEEMKRKNGK